MPDEAISIVNLSKFNFIVLWSYRLELFYSFLNRQVFLSKTDLRTWVWTVFCATFWRNCSSAFRSRSNETRNFNDELLLVTFALRHPSATTTAFIKRLNQRHQHPCYELTSNPSRATPWDGCIKCWIQILFTAQLSVGSHSKSGKCFLKRPFT